MVGFTVTEPDFLLPVEKLVPLHEVALVELHESEDEPPEVRALGVAVKETIGGAPPLPPPPQVFPIRYTVPRNVYDTQKACAGGGEKTKNRDKTDRNTSILRTASSMLAVFFIGEVLPSKDIIAPDSAEQAGLSALRRVFLPNNQRRTG